VDLTNQTNEIKEIDVYARDHFKERCNSLSENIVLRKLVRAQYQVVAGMNYRLIYSADGYRS